MVENEESIVIKDDLYAERNESKDIISTTETLLPDVDKLLIDKVRRIIIKGQLDGN